MANTPRLVKTFHAVGKRFYPKGQPPRTERPEPGIDDHVNDWVTLTGNIIINATSSRHTVMEKATDGTLIRKTTQILTVVYQAPDDFLESESELRRRALIPTPKAQEEDEPTPMSNDEERRQEDVTGDTGPVKVDGDAGGPEGIDQVMPADDEDDF